MSKDIEALVERSIMLATERATTADCIYATIATLQRIHHHVIDFGGVRLAVLLEASIRDRLIVRAARARTRCSAASIRGAGPGASIATAIIGDAADACLVHAAEARDQADIFALVFVLIDRLIEMIGAIPDADIIIRKEDGSLLRSLDSAPIDSMVGAVVH